MERITYSAEYISYLNNGESAAVFITRDIAKEVPTKGMWVDVIKADKKGRQDGRWDFNSFVVELFPRKTQPVYPLHATESEKKYITWQTAHKDIDAQRRLGYHGAKYKVCPRLVNRNKGKFTVKRAVWNVSFGEWVPHDWYGPNCEWRDKKIPITPKWEYEILSVKKI